MVDLQHNSFRCTFTLLKNFLLPECICTYKVILLSHKKEQNNAICRNMDGLRDCHTKSSKSDRERKISYDIAYVWNLKKKKNGTNEFIYKTEIKSQM